MPFFLLASLVVILAGAAWLEALSDLLRGKSGGLERQMLWFLPGASFLLLVATVVMHIARRRAIAASALTGWRLEAFTSASNEVAWETTVDGVITFAGLYLRDVLGYDPDEVVGRKSESILAPGQLAIVAALREQAIAGSKGWTEQPITYVTKAGERKELVTSALLRQDRDGNPTGFTGLLRETAQGKQASQDDEIIRARIQTLLANSALRIVLQPIINTTTGGLIGVEALSRFPTADIPPDRWFQQAARVGLDTDLELLAIATALTRAADLPPNAYLSINASPRTLADGRVHRLIQQSSRPARLIIVEITEHEPIDDYSTLRPAIADLRTLGVRLAVDDAGSGYASFRHILELQPDYIKLDRQIIDGIDSDPAKRALVVALVAFGREVGATIIAEGIEVERELQTVTRLGVGAAQGYYIGAPSASGGVTPR